MLAAGLEGIKNNLKPVPPVNLNIFKLTDEEKVKYGIESLPGSLFEGHSGNEEG